LQITRVDLLDEEKFPTVMDLTKEYPRGPRERLAGVAMLARTIDKARAQLAGTFGEYIYDCPMDRNLFAALGVSADEFLDIVWRSPDDIAVVAWLRGRNASLEGANIEQHNSAIDAWAPKSPEGQERFIKQREAIAPGRTDITTWTDLIDVEEGRLARAFG
jgi:hypothetical protein